MPGSQIQFASHATPRAPGRLPGTVIRPYVAYPSAKRITAPMKENVQKSRPMRFPGRRLTTRSR